MKTIRSFMVLTGLSVAFLALGTAGARGQVLEAAHFAGTFTLPFEAQWGGMTLPAGEYSLNYGTIFPDGGDIVEVAGKAAGSPHGVILAWPTDQTSATKNAIVCIREGDALIVRTLEMPAIGKSIRFQLPRGVELLANQGKHKGNIQLAEVRISIEHVPVKLSGK